MCVCVCVCVCVRARRTACLKQYINTGVKKDIDAVFDHGAMGRRIDPSWWTH